MGRLVLVLVIALATACGKVNLAADASRQQSDAPRSIDAAADAARPIDAHPDAAPPDAFVDPTATCRGILRTNPHAGNGPYTAQSTGKQFYCYMTAANGPIQYDELAFGQYDVPHTGFSIIAITELQDPVVQQAFIFLWNYQGAQANTIAPWTSNNCCFTMQNPSNGMRLLLGGQFLYPGTNANPPVMACNGTYSNTGYRFVSGTGSAVPAPSPMPTNFFQTYPPTEGSACSDGSNPAFFFKKQ